MIWLSTEYFHFMGMCTFQTFHGFSSTLLLRDSEEYGKYLCFPMLFLYYVNSLFPYFGKCMDFCFTQNIWETPTFKCLFFHILFPYYENSHFPCFGNYMDFCFTRKFKKPINLKCLCFPTLFPCYENSLFLCFGNCMNFCFIRKI